MKGFHTSNKTPALTKTLAAMAIFLLVRLVDQAIRKDMVTTREKQKPITIA
jgi:hypothetical protein